MAENVNPGSALGDFVEEFKKAPPAGKIAIVGVVLAVIAVAIYMRKKAGANAATPAQGLTPGGSSNNGTGGGGGSSTMPTPLTPGNPAQPTPTKPTTPIKQGGGSPPTRPIIQPKKPVTLPSVGYKPAPKPIVARSPQSTYKQVKPAPAPQGVHRPGGNYGITGTGVVAPGHRPGGNYGITSVTVAQGVHRPGGNYGITPGPVETGRATSWS